MKTGSALLRLERVSKAYETVTDGAPLTVLSAIDLELTAGDSVAITGPSGCGKSTLLNIIGTLDRPTAGRVMLDGRDLAGLDEAALAEVRSRQIGFVFQAHHLLPQCTVWENVLVPTLALKDRAGSAAEHASGLLDRVGLSPRLDHRPAELSGGERQRVALVRALVNRPKLLLADEPTGALDGPNAEALTRLLVDLNREQGVTLVIVTHAEEVAGQMCRRWRLREGYLTEAR
jgi:ABC-type lipoprotein export system ATPase subunit